MSVRPAMIRERSATSRDAGFSEEDSRRALDALPIATHNQRGGGSLLLGPGEGTAELPRPEDLIEILKIQCGGTHCSKGRTGCLCLIRRIRIEDVEDVVREILAGSLNMFQDFGEDSFVSASQVTYESMHKHDAFAEAFGQFGELREELIRQVISVSRTDL